jgi:hypothetical protein
MLVRKGLEEEASVQTALASNGLQHLTAKQISYKCVFWIPLPLDHRKRTKDLTRGSIVPDVLPFELAALRDGVIEEVVMNAPFPDDTPDAQRDMMMTAAWERLYRHRWGQVGLVPPEPGIKAPTIIGAELEQREQQRRSIVIAS